MKLETASTKEVLSSDIIAYTDGSFQDHINNGYGIILTNNKGDIVHISYGQAPGDKDNLKGNTQVELFAALSAVREALNRNARSVTIVYDCNPIVSLLTCDEIRSDASLYYREQMEEFKNQIQLRFKRRTNTDILHKKAHNLSRYYLKKESLLA